MSAAQQRLMIRQLHILHGEIRDFARVGNTYGVESAERTARRVFRECIDYALGIPSDDRYWAL